MILDLILIAGAVAAAVGICRVLLWLTLTEPSRARAEGPAEGLAAYPGKRSGKP